MDTKDGKIYTEEEFQDKFDAEEQERMVEFDPDDQTKKQRESGHISLHDHRSKLGKVLTTKRREMGFHRKR
jgi:hypothetical protein